MKSKVSLLTAGLLWFLSLSTPGQTQWHLRHPLPTASGLLGATYANGLFVAVGYHHTIITSPDAAVWTARSPEGEALLTDVAYGNGRFVVVGVTRETPESEHTLLVLTSSDGIDWQAQPPQPGLILTKLVFADGLFVGIGGVLQPEGSARPVICSSPDGLAWTQRWVGQDEYRWGSLDQPHRLVVGENTLVVTLGDTILVSTNGVVWKASPSPVDASGTWTTLALSYGAGSFLALANVQPQWENPRSEQVEAWLSADGVEWARHLIESGTPARLGVSGIAYGDGQFIGVGQLHEDAGSKTVGLVSKDGRQWTIGPLTGLAFSYGDASVHTVSRLSYANRTFLLVGQPQVGAEGANVFARIFTSPDGLAWTRRLGANNPPLAGTAGPRGLIALSPRYEPPGTVVLRSPQGSDWTPAQVLEGSLYHSLASSSEYYIAAGDAGILTSPDGTTWTPRPSAGPGWYRLRASGGKILALGSESGAAKFGVSGNGEVWETRPVNYPQGVADVASDGESIVIVASVFEPGAFRPSGVILRSSGATGWTEVYRGAEPVPDLVAFGNGRYVAIERYLTGHAHALLTSSNGISWASHPRFAENVITDLIFAEGHFYATENNLGSLEFRLWRSADGVHWTSYPVNRHAYSPTLAASPQGLFAFAEGGVILQSPWDLAMEQVRRGLDGTVSFRVRGGGSGPFTVEATGSLAVPDWRAIPVSVMNSDPPTVVDDGAASFPTRFYRVRPQ